MVINLWLDDIRKAPPGFVHARSVSEAMALMDEHTVDRMSLDHDLGGTSCDTCKQRPDFDERWGSCGSECRCQCHNCPTGYDFVKWMVANDKWPRTRPTVHSANPVGRDNLLQLIERYWDERNESGST